MTYQLITPESYEKKLAKFLKTHPELINSYKKTLELLEINPYHPSLRLHSLTRKMGRACETHYTSRLQSKPKAVFIAKFLK
jgi:mRNA-degrading endonuclease YafQ of YafQ-DinJ toxin-antitoxin module